MLLSLGQPTRHHPLNRGDRPSIPLNFLVYRLQPRSRTRGLIKLSFTVVHQQENKNEQYFGVIQLLVPGPVDGGGFAELALFLWPCAETYRKFLWDIIPSCFRCFSLPNTPRGSPAGILSLNFFAATLFLPG